VVEPCCLVVHGFLGVVVVCHQNDSLTVTTPQKATPPKRPQNQQSNLPRPPKKAQNQKPTCASIHDSSASASSRQLMERGPGRVASNLLGSSSARGSAATSRTNAPSRRHSSTRWGKRPHGTWGCGGVGVLRGWGVEGGVEGLNVWWVWGFKMWGWVWGRIQGVGRGRVLLKQRVGRE